MVSTRAKNITYTVPPKSKQFNTFRSRLNSSFELEKVASRAKHPVGREQARTHLKPWVWNAINCTICTCNTLNLPAIRLTTISPIVVTTSPILVSLYHLYLWKPLHSLHQISNIWDHYEFQIEFHGPSRVLVENCGGRPSTTSRRPFRWSTGGGAAWWLAFTAMEVQTANCFGGDYAWGFQTQN